MWRRAIQLLDLMKEMDVPKTVVTYNTVISACARSREVGMAKNLLSQMRKEGIRPDVVSFNSVIGACASTSRWKDALAVLDQCYREPGVTPNVYVYTNAMRYVIELLVTARNGKRDILLLCKCLCSTGVLFDTLFISSLQSMCTGRPNKACVKLIAGRKGQRFAVRHLYLHSSH